MATTETANLEAGGTSQWTAVEPGAHSFGAVDTGATLEESGTEPGDLEILPGEWVTVITIGSAEAGNLRSFAVPIDARELVPGTSMLTFVNALDGETRVNFDRDGVVYVSELAPPGNADGLMSHTSVPETRTSAPSPRIRPASRTTLIGERKRNWKKPTTTCSRWLRAPMALVVMHETRFAEMLMARGDLEAPGTLLEAARANNCLARSYNCLRNRRQRELTGEGRTPSSRPPISRSMKRARGWATTRALANWVRAHIVEGDLKFGTIYESDSLTALSGDTLASSR